MTGVTGLAVAGVGWLGESLVKDLGCAPSLRLAAVQDIRLDLAREVAARHGCSIATDSFTELIGRPDVQTIAICTPNALHVPQAQQALRAGKHVLVQKPLALSAADAAATVALSRQQGRLLFVDYTYRFLETTQVLLHQAAHGVRAARAVFHNIYGPGVEKRWFFDPKLSGGGALIDLGVHLLDLLLWLLKPAAVELSDARLQWPPVQSAEQLEQPPVESAARLRLQCDDVPVEVDVSWSAPRPHTEIALELETSTGVWRWENVDGSFFRFRTRRDGHMLLERETSLRSDTLRAFEHALHAGDAPPIDVRVYGLLEQAYQQAL